MPKTLILTDVHHRIDLVDEIVALEKADKVIWTGDYQDQFEDTPEDAKKTAIWLKGKLEDPRNVMIIGNHDWTYMYPDNKHAYCSGFSDEKSEAIRKILNKNDFAKLKSFHVENNILFSHAGISKRFLDFVVKKGDWDEDKEYSLENIVSSLEDWTEKARLLFPVGGSHPLFMAGWDRGGRQDYGGIIWEDSRTHFPIKGLKQIFGHTPGKKPYYILIGDHHGNPILVGLDKYDEELKSGMHKGSLETWGLCIDTHTNHYAIIEDEIVLTVKTVKQKRVLDTAKMEDKYILVGVENFYKRLL